MAKMISSPQVEKPVDEQAPAVAPVYTIADGKAVTAIRGVLAAGAVCQPSDFYGGQETFDNLVEKGFVVTQ